MVTIKDGCGCDPCDCDWKQKLKEAYSRAIQSVNKIGDNDGSVYFPDGTGFVKLPLPRQSDVAQIRTNTEDIVNLKARDIQLQADINAETTAREDAITAEASAREAGITAEASAREAKDNQLDAYIARIDNTNTEQNQRIQDNAGKIQYTYNELVTTEKTVATHNSEIITLQANNQALAKSLVSDVLMTDGTTAGSVQVSIEKEDGTLITSANYRWGKDIGIRLEAGTQEGYVKAVISLSDGTELVSNEYKIVEVLESDVYVTAITLIADQAAGTLGGNISYSNGTTQTINSVSVPTAPGVTSAIEALQGRMTAVEQKNANQDASITAIDERVQALENTPGIGQFAAGKLGTIAGSTTDGRIKAEDDGTGSVNGWGDLKSRVTAAEEQIVAAQNDIGAIETKNTEQDTAINGKVSITQGAANAGKALVVGSDGNVIPGDVSGGEVWEEVDLNNLPTDWVAGDRIRIQFYYIYPKPLDSYPSSWTTAPSGAATIDYEKDKITDIKEFELKDADTYNYILIMCRGSANDYIAFTTIQYISGVSKWNSGGVLFNIYAGIFNGAGKMNGLTTIPRSAVTAYIYKMYRLKK